MPLYPPAEHVSPYWSREALALLFHGHSGCSRAGGVTDSPDTGACGRLRSSPSTVQSLRLPSTSFPCLVTRPQSWEEEAARPPAKQCSWEPPSHRPMSLSHAGRFLLTRLRACSAISAFCPGIVLRLLMSDGHHVRGTCHLACDLCSTKWTR